MTGSVFPAVSRRVAALSFLLAFLLILSACSGESPEGPGSSASAPATEAVTDAPPDPGPSVLELNPPTPFFAEAELGAIGPDRLVFCSKPGDGSDATLLSVWEIGADSFAAEYTVPGTVSLLGASPETGRVAVRDRLGQCTVFDASFREIASLTLPSENTGVAADASLSRFYYADYGTLFAFSAETGERTAVPVGELTVEDVSGWGRDADGEFLVLTVWTSPYVEETATVRFRPSDGTVIRANRSGTDFSPRRVVYASGSRFGLMKNSGPGGRRQAGSIELVGWDGDVLRYWTPEDASGLGLGIGAELTALSEETLLLSYTEEIGGQMRFRRLDLTRFLPGEPLKTGSSAETISGETESFLESVSNTFAAPKTSSLRGIADELEEQYGITIFVSEECIPYRDCNLFDMKLTSEGRTREEEQEKIDFALEALSSALSLFPEGIFRQFRTETGLGGLRIYLSGALFANGIDAAGLTDGHGVCCNVVLSVNYSTVRAKAIHELWHALEYFCHVHDLLPDTESWAELNPPEFEYGKDYSGFDGDDGRYTYPTETDPEEIWFVTKYAKINANEDRARILEKLLTDESAASLILQSPHIRAKLDRMSEFVRAAFDDTGWGDLPWERTEEPAA